MPYSIKTISGDDRPFKIVSKKTGRTVGTSKTKEDAKASVRARYQAEAEKNAQSRLNKMRRKNG